MLSPHTPDWYTLSFVAILIFMQENERVACVYVF